MISKAILGGLLWHVRETGVIDTAHFVNAVCYYK